MTVRGSDLDNCELNFAPFSAGFVDQPICFAHDLVNARCFSIYALQLKEHIINRLFAIKATNLQTVLQLLSVLKEATAFSDVGVSPESMVIFL